MKIEMINERQIRCTLTRSDLEEREINLGELVYGSDKAKELFNELMHQAAVDFGFEVDNAPIMIEATPMASDKLVLNITKVESPDELDLRFSRFTDFGEKADQGDLMMEEDDGDSKEDNMLGNEIAEGIRDLLRGFDKAREDKGHIRDDEKPVDKEEIEKETVLPEQTKNLVKIYKSRSLDDIIDASLMVAGIYNGKNALYKDEKTETYYLITHQGKYSAEDFLKISQTIVLYLSPAKYTPGIEAHIKEHFKCIIKSQAIKKLSGLAK